jgi:hypothetical protein
MTFIPKWAAEALYKESKYSQDELEEVRSVGVVKIQQKAEKREIIRIKKKLSRPPKER